MAAEGRISAQLTVLGASRYHGEAPRTSPPLPLALHAEVAAGKSILVSVERAPMALMPCAYCHRVPKARLFTLIWAWTVDRQRIAVKMRSCAQCIPDATTCFGEPLPEKDGYVQLPTDCHCCNQPTLPDELAVTYLTWWDADGQHSDVFCCCDGCSSLKHAELAQHGELMPDKPLPHGLRGR